MPLNHLWSRRLLQLPTHGGHVLMLSSISNDILSCHMFIENPEDDVWVHTGCMGGVGTDSTQLIQAQDEALAMLKRYLQRNWLPEVQ